MAKPALAEGTFVALLWMSPAMKFTFLFSSLLLFGAAPAATAQNAESPTPAAPVEVENITPDDAIRDRLTEILSKVDGFEEVEVDVQAGVVTLSGEIADERARQDALTLVSRTDGVVMARDRMLLDDEIAVRLSPTVEKFRDMWRTTLVKFPLVVAALVMGGFFWCLAGFVSRRESWFKRLGIGYLARELVRRVVRVALIGIGILLALEILELTAIVGAVLGAAGLAGLAIGFAFKNIVENYLAGILLSTRNPFEIGDYIEVGGKIGKVALLSSRDTVLVTLDGNHLRIPNSVVMNSELLNYTRNPLRRFDFEIGVGRCSDLGEARRIGLETIATNPGVLAEPKTIAVIDRLGDSSVVLRFFAWLDQRKHDFLRTKSESIRLVKEAYDAAGIAMPEPVYRVLLPGGAAAALGGEGEAGTHEGHETAPRPPAQSGAPLIEDDLSVDHTIDDQIEEEQKNSDEMNLLPKKKAKE